MTILESTRITVKDRPPGSKVEPMHGLRYFFKAHKVFVLAVWAICATLLAVGFGTAWASQQNRAGEEAQVSATSRDFLMALTNFNPKTVGTDFGRIQSYATGKFATQATSFFGTSIRRKLAVASASSRGHIKHLFVESLGGSSSSVYAVVNQTYVNTKIKSPKSDILRMVLDLSNTSKGWRISSVTVLS
ncbi:MAG: hypothetical protein ACYDGY_01355 [Acidimicrobiales bacterium]